MKIQNLIAISALALIVSNCAHAPKASLTNSSNPALNNANNSGEPALNGLGDTSSNDEFTTVTGDELAAGEVEKIPLEVNRLVLKWIEYFQGRGHEIMETYLERSSRYLPLMQAEFEKQGLPKNLVYIALIESGFSPKAQSSAGAVGYWQFMRGTGKDYDLKITPLIDERRDPVLATRAAGRYFKGLYSLFGDWYLAIAAYNVGENRIKSIVMRTQTRNFWEIARQKMLPKETINYVPKFLAARLIGRNPAKYGFTNISYQKPFEFETVELDRPVNLRKLAETMDLDYADLKALNPMYRKEMAPLGRDNKLVLRVPKGDTSKAMAGVGKATVENARVMASQTSEDDFAYYKIRGGDTLSTIAKHHRISVQALMRLNNLNARYVLRVGKKIKVPATYSDDSANHLRVNQSRKLASHKMPQAVSHKLKLQSKKMLAMSSVKKSSAQKNKQKNKQKNNAHHLVARRTHVIRSGETLSSIARNYSVDLKSLIVANKIRSRSRVLVGTALTIPDRNRSF